MIATPEEDSRKADGRLRWAVPLLHASFWLGLACVSSASSIIVLYGMNRWVYAGSTTLSTAASAYALAALHGAWRSGRLGAPSAAFLAATALVLQYLSERIFLPSWQIMLSPYYLARHVAGDAFLFLTFFVLRDQLARWRQRAARDDLERRVLRAEVQALRCLVSPHFLLNSLNNVQALLHFHDERASDYVTRLGDLMRYVLQESDSELVALRRELEFVERYVELHRTKLGRADIRLDLPRASEGPLVPPMLLIHLVENCFKHGDVHTNLRGWIDIRCRAEAGRVLFETRNTVPDGVRPGPEHVGLASVRAVLAYAYPGGHVLETGLSGGVYAARLEIEAVP